MENNLHVPLSERLKTIPEFFGIRLNEEPDFDLIVKDGAFEIRQYGRQTRARVTVTGTNSEEFRETAFRKLAHYIFGGNGTTQDIAMTAPVIAHQDGLHTWTMEFVLPAEIDLHSAPAPQDNDVVLTEVEPYLAAVMTYSGSSSEKAMQEHKTELLRWLEKQSGYRLADETYSAQYDAPFVIPFLRKNEVQAKVTRSQPQ